MKKILSKLLLFSLISLPAFPMHDPVKKDENFFTKYGIINALKQGFGLLASAGAAAALSRSDNSNVSFFAYFTVFMGGYNKIVLTERSPSTTEVLSYQQAEFNQGQLKQNAQQQELIKQQQELCKQQLEAQKESSSRQIELNKQLAKQQLAQQFLFNSQLKHMSSVAKQAGQNTGRKITRSSSLNELSKENWKKS